MDLLINNVLITNVTLTHAEKLTTFTGEISAKTFLHPRRGDAVLADGEVVGKVQAFASRPAVFPVPVTVTVTT